MEKDSDETLIKEVERYDLIYNKKHPLFKDKRAKENAWQAIASVLNMNVDQCRQRWVVLRNRYGNERRITRTTPSGSSRRVRPQWIYFESMGYLDRHMSTRKTWSNMPQQSCSNENALEVETFATPPWDTTSDSCSQATDIDNGNNETDTSNINDQDSQNSAVWLEEVEENVSEIGHSLSPAVAPVVLEVNNNVGQLRSEVRIKKQREGKQKQDTLSQNIGNAMEQFGQFLANENKNQNEITDPELSFGKTVGLMIKQVPQNRRLKVEAEIMNIIAGAASDD